MTQAFTLLFFFLIPIQSGFNWISFNMVKRTNANGMTSKLNARVFYSKTGEMVTYFTNPSEMFILNNSDGEIKFYNPIKNTIYRTLNDELGSQNTTFFYFLSGNVDDLGLSRIGFTLKSSRVEDMMLISLWDPPKQLKKLYGSVELVSDGTNPVFLGYYDLAGNYLKKIYYYNFQKIKNKKFPFSITEIDYFNADSVVTKTTFDQFDFDNAADQEFVFLKIPDDAKLIE